MQSSLAADANGVPGPYSNATKSDRLRLNLTDASLVAGIVIVIMTMLWLLYDARTRTQQIAEHSELNVVEALASDISHNFESLSQSIDGTIKAAQLPGVWDLPREIRASALFSASIQVKSLSMISILGKDGQIRITSHGQPTRDTNFFDREYFQFHLTNPDSGLHFSAPITGRTDGLPIIVASKRLNDSDGNFAGVVTGGIRLSFFDDLFHQINLGEGGAVGLFTTAGRVVSRLPKHHNADGADIHRAQLFTRAAQQSEDAYVDISPIDGRQRLVAYRTIDGFPFIVSLAQSTDFIFAGWLRLSLFVGGGIFLLSGFKILLILRLRRAHLRRTEAEQHARLSAAALATINQDLEARIQHEVQSRKETLDELAVSRRLEALGQLSGGIAHDINNVLQTISGTCSLLQERNKQNEDVQRLLRFALSATDRGSAITRRLLVFARRAVIKPEKVDIGLVLADLQELLDHTLFGSIHITLDLPGNLPDILVDRMQLETVLVNLATNARDAMPNGGTITVAVRVDTVQKVSAPSTQFVCLSMRDTGTGMDPLVLARATEPFFSTKDTGQGTGLGLSMAKGFAEQSNGRFEITSRVGQGTTVSLWFPAFTPAHATLEIQPDVMRSGMATGALGTRVMVVDDNQKAREIMCEWLSSSGLVSYQASSGADALAQMNDGLTIDLLLTDLSMPQMDGIKLIQAARKLQPQLSAIILTGNTGAVASLAIEDVVGGKCLVLQKPIRLPELTDQIEIAIRGMHASPTLALLGLASGFA